MTNDSVRTEALETKRMIHVHELTKSYADLRRGPFVALAGVSFAAREGEIYGLLGPNGAGKTSILRILSTVLRPTSGTATVNGWTAVRMAERPIQTEASRTRSGASVDGAGVMWWTT
jgi:ABC-type Na+ transport system ATPase subunit NatA